MAASLATRFILVGSAASVASGIRHRHKYRNQYEAKSNASSCSVPDAQKQSCGFNQIGAQRCLDYGCCFFQSSVANTPWCFLSSDHAPAPAPAPVCSTQEYLKRDCSPSTPINRSVCEATGCCFHPAPVASLPDCYYNTDTATPPTPTPSPPPAGGFGRSPVVYQISTRPWLYELAQGGLSANCTNNRGSNYVCLRDVPDSEWQKIKDDKADMVWLMGMWELGAESLGEAMALKEDMKEWYGVPDLEDEDIIGSPYAPVDYKVNPEIGNDEDLEAVRAKLNGLGMGLMVDFVPNHFARDSKLFYDHPEAFIAKPEGDTSPANWWYEKNGHTLAFGRGPYDGPWTDTLNINYWSPAARTLVSDIFLSLARRVDGIRLDMAHLILNDVIQNAWGDVMTKGGFTRPETEFWLDAITRAKTDAGNPNLIIVSEAYDYYMTTPPEQELLTTLGVDYSYNKQVLDVLEQHPPSLDSIRNLLFQSPQWSLNRMCHFVENHDEPRAALSFGGADKAFAGSVAALTLPGMRLTYFGQYDGLKNRLGVHLRRAMPEARNSSTHAKYTKLMGAISNTIFHEGTWTLIDVPQPNANSRLFAWRWEHGGEKRLVVVNWADHQETGLIQVADAVGDESSDDVQLTDLLTDARLMRKAVDMRGAGMSITLTPWKAHVFSYVAEDGVRSLLGSAPFILALLSFIFAH